MVALVEKGFFFSSEEFRSYYKRQSCGAEIRFELIYELAEKQALKKQEMSPNESFILADCIKAELVDVLPCANFGGMSKKFLMDFVVVKGIISEEQARHARKTRVCIRNGNNRIVGIFNDNIKAAIFAVPSTPSTVTKMKGVVEWYLCLDKDGVLTLKHHTMIVRSDFLLAEMKSSKYFTLTPGETTTLTACYNNLKPLV